MITTSGSRELKQKSVEVMTEKNVSLTQQQKSSKKPNIRDLITEKAAGEHTLSGYEKKLYEYGKRIMQLEQKAV